MRSDLWSPKGSYGDTAPNPGSEECSISSPHPSDCQAGPKLLKNKVKCLFGQHLKVMFASTWHTNYWIPQGGNLQLLVTLCLKSKTGVGLLGN